MELNILHIHLILDINTTTKRFQLLHSMVSECVSGQQDRLCSALLPFCSNKSSNKGFHSKSLSVTSCENTAWALKGVTPGSPAQQLSSQAHFPVRNGDIRNNQVFKKKRSISFYWLLTSKKTFSVYIMLTQYDLNHWEQKHHHVGRSWHASQTCSFILHQ